MRVVLCLLLAAMALGLAPSARAGDRFVFNPEADTYVDFASPTESQGRRGVLEVDGNPTAQALIRFRVAGISGRVVTGVRLRLFSEDFSPSGGSVYALTSTGWD